MERPASLVSLKFEFEAAGIRGLIDPGGYSAPANAAAASGLISGVADIRRTENGAGSHPRQTFRVLSSPK